MATVGDAEESAPYAAWREELAPWLQALREAKLRIPLPPLPTVSDIEALWIHVKAPAEEDAARKQWTLFIEALELMELLARVDLCAAWLLLLELTGRQHVVVQYEALLFGAIVLPKFVVDVHDDHPPDMSTFQGLTRLLLDDGESSTPNYLRLTRQLEKTWSEQHDGQVFDREQLGRVKLSIEFEVMTEFDSDAAVTASLRPILLFATAASSALTPEVDRGVFTMVSFRYNLGCSMPAVTNLVLDLVNQASLCIHISHFVIARLYQRQLDRGKTSNFIQDQLVPWLAKPDEVGIQDLQLDVQTLDVGALHALCSAIACSKGLREFSFPNLWLTEQLPHEVDESTWWPWLVYALFSHETSHEIRSVVLTMDLLDPDDVGVPRQVLQCLDPLAYLLQLPLSETVDGAAIAVQESDQLSSPMAAAFREDAIIRLGNHAANSDPEASESTIALPMAAPFVPFRVTRNQAEEDFIEFLYPGVEICWTERSSLLELTPVKQRETHPVRHLTFKYLEVDTIEIALELLEVVESLKRLDIKKGTLDSLSWFAEPHDSLFKLETLCLDKLSLADVSSWSLLVDALKDPSHPLAQSLRQLHIGAVSFPRFGPRPTYPDELFGRVVNVLEHNRHLTRCELWTDSTDLMTKYSAAVLARNGDYIPEEEAPLTPAQKFAFLGVITQQHDDCDSPRRKNAKRREHHEVSARFKLNAEMTKLVFEYAATAKSRVSGIQLKLKRV